MKLKALTCPWRRFVSGFVLALCLVHQPGMAQPAVPQGWRLPTSDELKDEWRQEEPNSAAFVEVDLDNDGIADRAVLAVRTSSNVEGLLIWLSSTKQWLVFDEGVSNPPVFMGLGANAPGKYKILCGESNICETDGTRTLILTAPSLSYYRPSSAGSVIYFDSKTRKLVQEWESD